MQDARNLLAFCIPICEPKGTASVGGQVKNTFVLALMLLAATFAVGQKLTAEAPEPFHLLLNDIVKVKLGMTSDDLPKATPERELRCSALVNDRERCKMIIHDEVLMAGARVTSVEFMLTKNKVTDINFDLDIRKMGPNPLVYTIQQRFGKHYGDTELPLLCWQNPVSNLLFFSGYAANVISMSLSEGCAKYELKVRKQEAEDASYSNRLERVAVTEYSR
jgi:hypothetical protein